MSSDSPKKRKFLDRLADENGVAIVVVDENSREVSVSNNNSICGILYSSVEFTSSCARYCGNAFKLATEAARTVEYECYAGLTCKAVPVSEGGRKFVAIVGRTFLKAENYRRATEKAIAGEWSRFHPTEFFENVLMTDSDENLLKVSNRLEKFADRQSNDILELDKPKVAAKKLPVKADPVVEPKSDRITQLIDEFNRGDKRATVHPKILAKQPDDAQEVGAWRSLFGSLMKLEYKQACESILEFFRNRYGLDSLVWLERREDRLEGLVALGRLGDKLVKIGIAADSDKLLASARREMPLELRERRKNGLASHERILNLFPVIVGGEIRGAIGIEAVLEGEEKKRNISRFVQTVASPLEILRLRDEVSQRDWLSKAVKKFNESLRRIDADDFWLHVTQTSAELLGAERASILIRNEKSNSLHAKAAIGSRINLLLERSVGSRVARLVLDSGSPVVVSDIERVGMHSAPLDWSYKTPSFISYPIIIGNRKIGVMNFTDKAGGNIFDGRDLELLQAIAPQIAVAIDRTTLKDKAGEYEQLSVTDSLTGLLNRRYIEERLTEEIARSKRHRFPVSLMMVDVDYFKSYNDSYGHPAGDVALKILADVLKETLRGADVAARYGGEEFAVLLPQTTWEEAAPIAERIRQRIERTNFPKRKVTVSIGIASCSVEIDSPKSLVSAADIALYEAKNHGRNIVQIFNNLGSSLRDSIN